MSQPNCLITKKRVEAGHHVGFLVYDGDLLVGWTGSGPKTDFPFLKTNWAVVILEEHTSFTPASVFLKPVLKEMENRILF
jgi:hypothetical protein